MITIILAVVAVLFCGIALLVGLRRKGIRSVMRFATFVLSFPISAFITKAIASFASDIGLGMTGDILDANTAAMLEENPALMSAIASLASAAAAPIIFVAVYILVELVLYSVYKVLISILKKPLNALDAAMTKPLSVALGGVFGVCTGAALLVAVLVPVNGYVVLASDAIASLSETGALGDSASTANEIKDKYIDEIKSNFVSTVTYNLGGRATFDSITSISANGKTAPLADELEVYIDVIGKASVLGVEMSEFGEEQSEAFDSITARLGDSVIFAPVASELLSNACKAWSNGESFAGISAPTTGNASYDSILTAAEVSFSDSDADSIQSDLDAISDLFAHFVDYGLFAALDDSSEMLAVVESEGFVSRTVEILYSNEHLAPIVPEFTKLSVSLLASGLGIPEDSEVLYQTMLGDIADAVVANKGKSEEERVVALNAELVSITSAYALPYTETDCALLAGAIIDQFGDADTVTNTEIEEFLTVYAYSKSQGAADYTNNVPLLPGYALISLGNTGVSVTRDTVVIPDKTPEEIAALLEKYSKAKYAGNAASQLSNQSADDAKQILSDSQINQTASDIIAGMVDSGSTLTVGDAVLPDVSNSKIVTQQSLISNINLNTPSSDAEIANASSSLENALKALVGLSNVASSGLNSSNVGSVLTQVGGAIDSLNNSGLFNEGFTTDLITGVLQSDTVSSITGMDKDEAASVGDQIASSAASSDGGYETVLGGVSTLVDYANILKNPDSTLEEKEAAVETMLTTLDENSLAVLKAFVTPSTLQSIGLNANTASNVSGLIFNVLDRMLVYRETASEAEYMAEVTSVNSIVSACFDIMEGENVDVISEAWVNTIHQSDLIMGVINTYTMNGAVLNPLDMPLSTSTLDEIYSILANASASNPSHASCYKSIGAFLGVVMK